METQLLWPMGGKKRKIFTETDFKLVFKSHEKERQHAIAKNEASRIIKNPP